MIDGLNNFLKNVTFFIPARRDSKGLKFKNRKLIKNTIKIIPDKFKDNLLISSNDEFLIELSKKENISYLRRADYLSCDVTSMKSVLLDASRKIKTKYIFLLYLTYPERTWKDIEEFISFFMIKDTTSMLCKKRNKVSPYLMMYEIGDFFGKQVIEHDLYRRQDYPTCFEISHFMAIFHKESIKDLNNNLYNNDTIFYEIEDKIDVDTPNDLKEFNEK